MVAASSSLKSVYRNDYSVKITSDATIEYNMNMMIDGITVSSSIPDTAYMEPVADSQGKAWPNGKPNPFKKLFPLDSVVKPFRPVSSGIAYAITGANGVDIYENPKNQEYSEYIPRLYYPGPATTYKYWVAPAFTNANLKVRYLQTNETWQEALLNKIVPEIATVIPIGNKAALTNKIVVRFDKWSLPQNFTIKIELMNGTFVTTTSFLKTEGWDGLVEFYYNGSTWSTTKPSEYPAGILIKSIELNATKIDSASIDGATPSRIAVIEVSARYIKNISADKIIDYTLTKQTSANENDILPVGFVNSNSLSINLADFNEEAINFKDYNRYMSSFASSSGYINPNTIYLSKNAEVKLYINTYHSNGALGSTDKYDRTLQGIFYIDSYSVGQDGQSNIYCLDGSKYLMDTLSPDLFLRDYPATAVLRVLLDNVGFSNYKFNLKNSTYVVDDYLDLMDGPDLSIPSIRYWWTDENATVWETIQMLCRDIQMNAFFDEDGILQFYSRDYMYSQDLASWTFRYGSETYVDGSTTKTKLPNIIYFDKKEIASANQVIIKWKSPIESNYLSNSTYLWQSSPTYLVAGGLRQRIPAPTSTITNAAISNGRINYTAINKYVVGQKVTVTGLSPDAYNVTDAAIVYANDTSFSVATESTETFIGGTDINTATITSFEKGSGTTKYFASNTFSVNDMVKVKGCASRLLDFSSYYKIIEATSSYFIVARPARGTDASGGIATTRASGYGKISPESTALYLNISQLNSYSKFVSGFNFAGYFMIDSEIIEFDAMEYQYVPLLTDAGDPNDGDINIKRVFISSSSEMAKHRYLSKNGYKDNDNPETAYFKPTGRYRIKNRGALGTTPSFHNATSDTPLSAWRGIQIGWGEGA